MRLDELGLLDSDKENEPLLEKQENEPPLKKPKTTRCIYAHFFLLHFINIY